MEKSSKAVLLGVLCAWLGLFGPLAAVGRAAQPAKAAESDLFASTNVLRIELTLTTAAMDSLRSGSVSRLRLERPYDPPVVRARVSEGGQIYTNVALSLKGASSFRPVDDRPAMSLNFEKFAPGQNFHGLRKLSLNNCVQDPTWMSEILCREVFLAHGIPVPRANYVLVSLNGRDLGLYLLIEGYNKQFLRQHFTNVSGNLYEGGVLKDFQQQVSVNSGDNPDDRSDLKRLEKAVAETRKTKDLAPLAEVLDVNSFLTMIGLEIVLCHCDSYAMNRNNYRLFHDLSRDKFVFLPHGMDRTFGILDRCPVDIPIFPALKGTVAMAVLGTAKGREAYLQRVRELNDSALNPGVLIQRIKELEARVYPLLKQRHPRLAEAQLQEAEALCQRIVQRKNFLNRELASMSNAVRFEAGGTLPLPAWEAVKTVLADSATVTRGGKESPALHAVGHSMAPAVWWRTNLVLLPGRYRFEGRIRTQGVPVSRYAQEPQLNPPPTGVMGDPTVGAMLTIGGRRSQVVRGETDWKDVSVMVEVLDSPKDLELKCVFKSGVGEAWFDLSSLRLRRVD